MRIEVSRISRSFKLLLFLMLTLCSSGLLLADEVSFNRDIRPVLSENCFYCHGQDPKKREADLRLDVRSAAIEAGAIAPGQLSESSLIERITSDDPDLMMPPADSNRKLSVAQKNLLKRWVR